MDLGQPGGAPPEDAAPKKGFKALWIAGGAVVLVLILGLVLISVLGGDSVSVPDQIDGVSRITSGPLAGVMDKQVNSSGLKGTNAVGALYGTPTSPEFLFIAAEGSESDSQDKAALQAAASSLGSGGALSLDTSSVTKQEVDGITYNCAPVTGSGLSGSACLWNGSGTLGMVLWFRDRGDPVQFASDVHDAVVS